MDKFPVPVAVFRGESRAVPAGNIFTWLGRGWSSFMAEPVLWVLMALALMVIMLALSAVPLIGGLVSMLLTPIFAAGMLCAAQRMADGQEAGFGDLFAGFSQKTGSLLILGALYAAAQLLIVLIVASVVGIGAFTGAARGDMAGVGLAVGGTIMAGILFVILSVPLCMAMWFAPALVFFDDAPPVGAIKASFNASVKNILPLIVYGLLVFLASIVAALPFMLGFLVFLPVLFGSVLASYRDVFARE